MSELKIINMEDVEVREVEWLWYPYIPFGKITIIQGDHGEGKTTAVLQISALLSREFIAGTFRRLIAEAKFHY